MKRLILLLGLLCSVALVFAGGQKEEPGQAPQVIRIMHYKDTITDYFDQVTELYTSRVPNVTFEIELATDDYWTKLAARDAAGAMPDIWANHSPGEPNTRPWIESGKIATLDDLKMLAELSEEYQSSLKIDGSTYFIPFLTTVRGLFYNEELIRAAGFDEFPETLTDLKRLCARLKEQGIIPFAGVGAHGFVVATSNFTIYWDLVTDQQWVDQMNAGSGSFEVIRPWGDFLQFFLENTQPSILNDQTPEMAVLLGTEQAAMMIDGPWNLQYINDIDPQVAQNFRLAAVPYSDDPKDVKFLNDFDLYFSVTKNERTEIAKDFIDFLVSDPEARKIFGESNRNFNPYGMDFGSFPAEKDSVALIEQGKSIPGEIFQAQPDGFFFEYAMRIQMLMTGDLTMDQFIEQLDETWRNLVK